MASYRSEVIRPPAFFEAADSHQIEMLRDAIPQRWMSGQRDSVEGVCTMLGEARDHHLYRKVGVASWTAYCVEFLRSPSEAMDELIEGVRILKARGSNLGPIIAKATKVAKAAKAAAERDVTDAVLAETPPAQQHGGRREGAGRKKGGLESPERAVSGKNQHAAPHVEKLGSSSAVHLAARINRANPDGTPAKGNFPSMAAAARANDIPVPKRKKVELGKPENVARRILSLGVDYWDAVVAAGEAQKAARRNAP